MNRHSMGLVKLCFGCRAKLLTLPGPGQGAHLLTSSPSGKAKGKRTAPLPQQMENMPEHTPLLFPILSLQLWQPDTQKHRSWDTHCHGFAQKHRKVRTPQCPGDKYTGKKIRGG